MLRLWLLDLVSVESQLQYSNPHEHLVSYRIRAKRERKAEGRKEEWRDCI